MEEKELWDRYRETGDVEIRNRLVEANLRLVHHVARQVGNRGAARGEHEELVSAGTVGLMQAVENFEPERGLAFSTFAAPRIRGAILDDHRRRDHAPRSVRRKQRDIRRAEAELAERHGRAPSDNEVATELGVDMQTLWRWQVDQRAASWVSLDRPVSAEEDGMHPEEVLPGDDGQAAEQEVTHGQELEIVKSAMAELSDQQQKVLALYYFEELKLHQIAGLLGVTESRISQVRSKALGLLRRRLGHLREEWV